MTPSTTESQLSAVQPVDHATGTVRGRLLLIGGPAPGAPRASRGGAVTLTGTSRSTAVVGPTGRFSTTLPVGVYEATGRSPQYGAGGYACQALGPVQVVARRTTIVDVYCQMA